MKFYINLKKSIRKIIKNQRILDENGLFLFGLVKQNLLHLIQPLKTQTDNHFLKKALIDLCQMLR